MYGQASTFFLLYIYIYIHNLGRKKRGGERPTKTEEMGDRENVQFGGGGSSSSSSSS